MIAESLFPIPDKILLASLFFCLYLMLNFSLSIFSCFFSSELSSMLLIESSSKSFNKIARKRLSKMYCPRIRREIKKRLD
jgi:hypothetical protein